ncbi:MAG: response regulator [Dehalococcoidia bacterium]
MARILVVDDSAFMRSRIAKLLEEMGHEAIEAGDGSEGVRKFAEERPDGVLLDITMPGTGGLEALRRIRGMDPAARVAMVTAVGQQTTVIEALNAGARDFVVKPYDPERVKAAVNKLVK